MVSIGTATHSLRRVALRKRAHVSREHLPQERTAQQTWPMRAAVGTLTISAKAARSIRRCGLTSRGRSMLSYALPHSPTDGARKGDYFAISTTYSVS
jgi:hypothetical protein